MSGQHGSKNTEMSLQQLGWLLITYEVNISDEIRLSGRWAKTDTARMAMNKMETG
ncbi:MULTISPECIES: hypothetical protein [Vibrio]|uniref:hypothetical protein n=1 Tax=Vibrio TaxID=662 RepID=UPI00142EEE24|nr:MULTISPECIES: hypothetical protein [Vibrio]